MFIKAVHVICPCLIHLSSELADSSITSRRGLNRSRVLTSIPYVVEYLKSMYKHVLLRKLCPLRSYNYVPKKKLRSDFPDQYGVELPFIQTWCVFYSVCQNVFVLHSRFSLKVNILRFICCYV